MTESRKWTHSLFALTMLGVFISAGTPLAGKGKPKPPPPPTPTLSYSITLLGTLGGFASEASDINERGDVVGRSQTADGSWAPFVYFIDTHEMVDLRDLLTPADQLLWRWDLFNPKGMNSTGQICGGALKLNESGTLQKYAVRITQQVGGTALVEIVSPVASVKAEAEGINEFGDVTGSYQWPEGIVHAFAYSDFSEPQAQDIGDLGGSRAAGFAINNLGEITGWSDNADGESHAFVFIPGEGMQDLGIIKNARGWNYSYGAALNDSAVVVGRSIAGMQHGSPVDHAFREAGNGMDDLKTLDGDSDSGAMSINSDGETVGWSVGRDSRWRGFLYSGEFGMLDLDSLITNLPAGTTGIVRWGIQINNAGEICGSFTFTGGTAEAFLLTPN